MSRMKGGVEINLYSQLKEEIKSRKDSVLTFTGIDKKTQEVVSYRIGITYSGGMYNLIASYNDYNKWGHLLPGEKIQIVKKTTKEDVIEYISDIMKRTGFKGDPSFSGISDYLILETSFEEPESPLQKKMNVLLSQIKKNKNVDWEKMEHSFENIGENKTLYSLLVLFKQGGRTLKIYVKGLSGSRLWLELETNHLNVTEKYIDEIGIEGLKKEKIKFVQI